MQNVIEPSDVHANSYRHRGTREGEGVGVDGTPPQSFWYVAVLFETICLQDEACILCLVALLETWDVTNNGLHLGFYQEFEIRLKLR